MPKNLNLLATREWWVAVKSPAWPCALFGGCHVRVQLKPAGRLHYSMKNWVILAKRPSVESVIDRFINISGGEDPDSR